MKNSKIYSALEGRGRKICKSAALFAGAVKEEKKPQPSSGNMVVTAAALNQQPLVGTTTSHQLPKPPATGLLIVKNHQPLAGRINSQGLIQAGWNTVQQQQPHTSRIIRRFRIYFLKFIILECQCCGSTPFPRIRIPSMFLDAIHKIISDLKLKLK